MDKQTLDGYRLLEQKIAVLERRLTELRSRSTQRMHGVARGSNPEFPYQPMTFHVSGYNIRNDAERRARISKLEHRLAAQKDAAEKQRLDIMEWISGIEDLTVQLIFTYKYVDGMTLDRIGHKLHLDKSNVSRKMDNYLKSQQMQQNTCYN